MIIDDRAASNCTYFGDRADWFFLNRVTRGDIDDAQARSRNGIREAVNPDALARQQKAAAQREEKEAYAVADQVLNGHHQDADWAQQHRLARLARARQHH